MSVLVFTDSLNKEITKSSFEAVVYGAKVASDIGTSCIAVSYGDVTESSLSALGKYGALKVLHDTSIASGDIQNLHLLVKQACEKESSKVVVFALDFTGKSVAPMAAAALKAGYISGAIDYPSSYQPITVKKNVFSGKAFANVQINTPVGVVAVLPNSVKITTTDASASIELFKATLPGSKIKTLETKLKGGEGVTLTEAEIVVSAGRGMKGPENWGDVEELARLLGAATACSRPVADIGWRPHHEHVGQTGVAIRPNLYIAIGISGAIQHLAGVNGSKIIVVINKDPEAPFFKAADYGIVGDAFDVLPKLVEAVRKLKAA